MSVSTAFRRCAMPVLAMVLAVCVGVSTLRADEAKAATPAGQSDAVRAGNEYVDQYIEYWRQEAEMAFRKRESDRLEAEAHAAGQGGSILARLPSTDKEGRAALVAMLEQTMGEVVRNLSAAADTIGSRQSDLLPQWRNVRVALNEKRAELFDVQANRQVAGQLASLLSVDNRWFWLCGLIAMISLVAVAVHERRHELRRVLNGGKARALGMSKALFVLLVIFAVATIGTFFFGNQIYYRLLRFGSGVGQSPEAEIAQENREIAAKIEAQTAEKQKIDARNTAAIAQWTAALRKASPGDTRLIDQWAASRERVENIDVELQLQNNIAQRLDEDSKALTKINAEIAASDADRMFYDRMKQWIRGGLGVCLLGIVLSGGALFQRGVRRRQEVIRDTCPLCLGIGTFEPIGRLGADQSGILMMECKREISTDPYEECGFTFAEDYRDMVKLCFPTLGIPQAGKTHWLAMTYRELNRGNRPAWVQFERIKSTSSDTFDRIIDEILDSNRRLGPEATQTHRIPHPLVFHFSDHDRWEPSHSLVNIFDYSGEVTRSHSIGESTQRQRALDGDGFFFFLDPTEPSETQVQALVNFRDDLRLIKRVKPGQSLRTPVALIVSKIDLMVTERYADPEGDGMVGQFYHDLSDIGWGLDLRSMEARSKVVSDLREVIWPGWDIEQSISDLFGGRYLFFPLSPVGLNEPGERDLTRRTISPVGLFQPLLWLLHMNGYQVLQSR